MASKLKIINAALVGHLGAARILSVTENSVEGRLVEDEYDDLRRAVLRDHQWNFASTRVSLAAITNAPVWEFDHAYLLPSDLLRLVDVDNPLELVYKVERMAEGKVIVTDIDAPLKIKYTADIEDANAMEPKFREALSARLAMAWAEPLTGVSSKTAELAKIYAAFLKSAKSVDGQEDSPKQTESDAWIDARL